MNPEENSDEQIQNTPKVFEPERLDISISEDVDQHQQDNVNQTQAVESQQDSLVNDTLQTNPIKPKSSHRKIIVLAIVIIFILLGGIGYAYISSNTTSSDNNIQAQNESPDETQSILEDQASYAAEVSENENSTAEVLENEKSTESLNKDSYQAIFLTDGNLYFGKLVENDDNSYTITNVFFLRGGEYVEGGGLSYVEGEDVSLAVLYPDSHNTKNLTLNTEEIIRWEDMDESADIPSAIKEYNNSIQQN